jgi:hypothetical protein
MAWGLVYTSFLLLAVGLKLIITIFKNYAKFLTDIKDSFSTWDDPTAFFITYLVGYAIIWWKPFWGSIIIIAGSILYVVLAGIDGPPIFAAPGFLVGVLYLITGYVRRRNHN